MNEINVSLDDIAEELGFLGASAEVFNALHACRPGHPWNNPKFLQFGNLLWMTSPYHSRMNQLNLNWLKKMAKEETKD